MPSAACPNCSKEYNVPVTNLNARARCKSCSEIFTLVLAADETKRSLRGGGWFQGASGCRSAIRGSLSPFDRSYGAGFRLARSSCGS